MKAPFWGPLGSRVVPGGEAGTIRADNGRLLGLTGSVKGDSLGHLIVQWGHFGVALGSLGALWGDFMDAGEIKKSVVLICKMKVFSQGAHT